ncbi:MAG: tetratricopeptide repeat protein [Micropepsaceae bacterium]
MSDVFQEVEEEYRRQQMAKIWEKYWIPIVGGAFALVLAVAAYQGWNYWRTEQGLASSRAFDAAVKELDADDRKAAAERFAKLGDKAVGGYAMLSRLHEAAIRGQAGDISGAQKVYDAVVESTSDPLFSDLARLRSAVLTVETASLDETRKRLDPVIAGSGPWRAAAIEILAYSTWRAGKKDDAIKLYDQLLALVGAPEKTQRRAKEMKALLEGGLTLAVLNKSEPVMPSSTAPGLLPFGLTPPQPEAPGSLLGPADMPVLPDPTQPEPDSSGTTLPTTP